MISIYKFKAKPSILNYVLAIIAILAGLVTFIKTDLDASKYWVFLLSAVSYYISTRLLINKAKKTFREIYIKDFSVKFSYMDQRKDPIAFEKKDLSINISEEELIFNNNNTQSFIGKVNKNESLNDWNMLIGEFNK